MIAVEFCNACGESCDADAFEACGGYCARCDQDRPAARLVKTREFRPHGCAMAPTAVDQAKADADFRVLDVSGRRTRIAWRDGRRQDVTARELARLQAAHTWAPDF